MKSLKSMAPQGNAKGRTINLGEKSVMGLSRCEGGLVVSASIAAGPGLTKKGQIYCRGGKGGVVRYRFLLKIVSVC